MNKIVPEKIHLNRINIFKSNMNGTQEFLDSPVEAEEIRVGYSQESGFNLEKKLVRIRLYIQIEGYRRKKPLGLQGEYGIEFLFIVENLEEYIESQKQPQNKNNKELYMVSSILGSTLMGIVYSTARGIILERTHGSYFRGVILPVINPNDLLKANK